MAVGRDIVWFYLPPHWMSASILIGVYAEMLQVKTVDAGDFIVQIHFWSKSDGFEWSFVVVYGAAQDQ
jgi:hypothetical protein